ncbi:hypothetical protein RirG_243950 [Rhizophagus irregularis DAOM 197198w]|uniref:Uncharacterized protein n=1 Tax=Rhizophagus irregularis (strain DAOM 197198w) TaxID=1432141 RepID=A0A015K1W9_RHIIW|nr:hypothetical protein RirG_243950 [Rhizophagus irregularis DAOM 197198w]
MERENEGEKGGERNGKGERKRKGGKRNGKGRTKEKKGRERNGNGKGDGG